MVTGLTTVPLFTTAHTSREPSASETSYAICSTPSSTVGGVSEWRDGEVEEEGVGRRESKRKVNSRRERKVRERERKQD